MNYFTWTGNPFVDTGLAVLIAKSGRRTLSEVTKDDLKKVFQDIKWLGNVNRKLKAYFLVVGKNGPLTQGAYTHGSIQRSALVKIKSLEKERDKLETQLSNETENKKISTLQRQEQEIQLKLQRAKKTDILLKRLDSVRRRLVDEINKENQKKTVFETKLGRIKADIGVLQNRISAPIDWNMAYYKVFLDELRQEVMSDVSTNMICEVTGLSATNVFNSIGAALSKQLPLTSYEKEDLETRKFELGRDWFPLAGSLGNDAQALPAGSRSPHISSLALLMAQLLPLGVIAISRNVNGKMKSYLVCLQFNVPEVNELIVKSIYEKVIAKVDFASEKNKLKTIGTGKGSKSLALFLLSELRELKGHTEFHNLQHLHLNVWLFSNFGTGADCDYFEVPSPSLRFLQTAAQQHYDEIKEILGQEVQTRYRYSLLEAIERKEDYEPLYPYERSKGIPLGLKQRASLFLQKEIEEDDSQSLLDAEIEGSKQQEPESEKKSKMKKMKQETLIEQLEKKAKSIKRDENRKTEIKSLIDEINYAQSRPSSKDLFRFYQTYVVGVSSDALSIAERMAIYLKQNLTGENNENLLSEMKLNHFNMSAVKNYFIQMAMDGKLTLDEYASLFTMEMKMPLKVASKGWKYIWFYLNHRELSDNQTNTIGGKDMLTHPKIKVFAKDYFDYFMGKRSLRKFESYVLERFEKGQVTSRTMQEWYCELAKVKEGYSSEEWDDLCKDENGNDAIYEVRFQMRLHFINLYREFKNNQSQSTN